MSEARVEWNRPDGNGKMKGRLTDKLYSTDPGSIPVVLLGNNVLETAASMKGIRLRLLTPATPKLRAAALEAGFTLDYP
jgi:hypothetical protein